MTPQRPNQHYAVPRTPEARLEITKAIQALAVWDRVQKASTDDPEHPGGRLAVQTAEVANFDLKIMGALLLRHEEFRPPEKLNVRSNMSVTNSNA
jgi:hypothetical protein